MSLCARVQCGYCPPSSTTWPVSNALTVSPREESVLPGGEEVGSRGSIYRLVGREPGSWGSLLPPPPGSAAHCHQTRPPPHGSRAGSVIRRPQLPTLPPLGTASKGVKAQHWLAILTASICNTHLSTMMNNFEDQSEANNMFVETCNLFQQRTLKKILSSRNI